MAFHSHDSQTRSNNRWSWPRGVVGGDHDYATTRPRPRAWWPDHKCDIVVVVVVIYLIYQGQGITPLPLAGFLHPAMMHSGKLPRCPPRHPRKQAYRNNESCDNRPLYLLLSGFARGQALGCHAVARADRMQKSMQKHCAEHGKRPVCRSDSSASSFNFFYKPLVLSLPPPRPSLGWDRPSCLWSWTCAWDQWEEAACHRRRLCCRCSCPVGSSRRAWGSRKVDRGTQETWGRNGASTCLLQCENASSKKLGSRILSFENVKGNDD